MDRWQGKVAIVTGASSGIGAAIAERLVKEGLQVAGLARRLEQIEELSKKLQGEKGKLHAIKADICQEQDVLEAFKWISDNLGPVHILINNAGIITHTNLIDGDTEKWKRTFDTNLLGLCIATREAVKIMRANKIDGHIVHINSISGHSVPKTPGINVYAASKFGVTAATETLRLELIEIGSKIKVTSVSPGLVSTEIFKIAGFDEATEKFLETMPRLKSEDVADAVMYVLGTPPHVQVHELTLKPIGELV